MRPQSATRGPIVLGCIIRANYFYQLNSNIVRGFVKSSGPVPGAHFKRSRFVSRWRFILFTRKFKNVDIARRPAQSNAAVGQTHILDPT